ncbi:MAG: outer membrane beta-barrel protein [Deltaproteobacteria bacterium]|nr:outer membrane beta-barrel protein [Deltaproteobacteria bacterium]
MRSAVATLLCFWAVLAQPSSPFAQQTPTNPAVAAQAFAEGQKLYRTGRFHEAIKAFSRAQKLAAHGSTLFNLARCYENLSEPAQAIKFYGQALKLTKIPLQMSDIRARIMRLKQLPTRVFVSSEPPGATIWLDDGATAAGKTPAVLKVVAGAHVVLLRLPDFELGAQRFEVSVGKEHTVHLKLRGRVVQGDLTCLTPTSISAKPCPRCREPRLIEFSGPHMHFTTLGGFLIGKELGITGGLGVQIAATIDRWRFGLNVQYMPVNPADIGTLAGTDTSTSFTMAQLDVGWVFPFGRWQLYSTAGVGGYLYRLNHDDPDPTVPVLTRESRGFMWGVAAGAEAMITSWLSLGIGIRLGVMHGNMMQPKVVEVPVGTETELKLEPLEESGHFPYATLWGGINFHL